MRERNMKTLKTIRMQQIEDRERARIQERERKIAEEQLEILRAKKLIEEDEEKKRLMREKIKAQQVSFSYAFNFDKLKSFDGITF